MPQLIENVQGSISLESEKQGQSLDPPVASTSKIVEKKVPKQGSVLHEVIKNIDKFPGWIFFLIFLTSVKGKVLDFIEFREKFSDIIWKSYLYLIKVLKSL